MSRLYPKTGVPGIICRPFWVCCPCRAGVLPCRISTCRLSNSVWVHITLRLKQQTGSWWAIPVDNYSNPVPAHVTFSLFSVCYSFLRHTRRVKMIWVEGVGQREIDILIFKRFISHFPKFNHGCVNKFFFKRNTQCGFNVLPTWRWPNILSKLPTKTYSWNPSFFLIVM